MIPESSYPTITPGEFKRKNGSRLESAGYFEWQPVNAPRVKAHFIMKKGDLTGYVFLRYVWKMKFLKVALMMTACISNYGHPMWFFKCPKCGHGCKYLTFIDGPSWICRKCSGGKSIRYPNMRKRKYRKMGIADIKKHMSSRSITKKKKALEKLIWLREHLLSQRQHL